VNYQSISVLVLRW